MNRISPDSTLFKEQHPSPTTPISKLGYRPELDGLRGISILLVYVHHLYHPLMRGGFFGVDFFFVLSGFLITSLLLQEWSREGSISLKDFYIRRALRLMPAVFTLVLIIGCFALIFLEGRRVVQTYQGIWLTLSYASNWLYAFGYFSANNPLGITWSLAIEEQFYLTWPLLLSFALRFKLRRRWILFILAFFIALISLHRKILAEHYGPNILRLYYASDTRADTLLIGCFAGLIFSWNLLPYDKWLEISMKFLAAVSVIFLAYLVGNAFWGDVMLYLRGVYTLVAVSIGVILVVLVVWPPKTVLLVLRFPPLVWIGRVSYGLYLWHWPVRWFIYPKGALPSVAQLVMVVILSLSLTTLSYYFVENPFLLWKKRFGSK